MSKQSKQYESMRQTQINTFSDGLNMDLHPLTTPNTILTDCVNGTMVTYDDNEFVLQNERGNTKIDNTQLSAGFIPVGMKEHNGILYIVSHNPETEETEIGTFPSPLKNTKMLETNYDIGIITDENINYSDYQSSIKYYDGNIIVSNYDKYEILKYNIHPLFELEHYILNKDGVTQKILLNHDGKDHSFSHIGEGILGYKYRPYYIDSLNTYFFEVSNGNLSRLNIEFSTSDETLINNLENLNLQCEIKIELKNSKESSELLTDHIIFSNENLHIYKNLYGEYTYLLDLEPQLTKLGWDYDYTLGIIKNDDQTFDKINITTTFFIESNGYKLYMDHLIKSVDSDIKFILNSPQIFTKFQYIKNENNKLNIEAHLDFKQYGDSDIMNSDIGEASFKLYELDENGNILGKNVYTPQLYINHEKYDINETTGGFGLHIEDNKYFYTTKNEINLPLSKSNIDECVNIEANSQAKYVKYEKVNNTTYNAILLDSDSNVLEYINVWSEGCNEDLIDERWFPDHIEYKINDVEYVPNTIYLLELTYPIKNKINKASFFVITTEEMFENTDKDRMDMCTIDDWFTPNYTTYSSQLSNDLRSNNTAYNTNKIPINSILGSNTDDDLFKLAYKSFLKFNPLLDKTLVYDEIPSIILTDTITYTVTENSKFNTIIEIDGKYSAKFNEYVTDDIIETRLELIGTPHNLRQQGKRKYIYDIFKNDPWEIDNIEVANIFYNVYRENRNRSVTDFIAFSKPSGKYSIRTINEKTNISGSGIEFISESDFDWIEDSKITKSSCVVNMRKKKCVIDLGGDMKDVHYIYSDDSKFGGTLQLMKSKMNMGNGLYFSKILTSDRVYFNDNSENVQKIWMHGKGASDKYVLIGLNYVDNAKQAWNILKRHLYYIENDNKNVIQYTFGEYDFDKNDINIELNGESRTINKTKDIICKSYPSQCLALNKDFSIYNIQSWNNLNPNLINAKHIATIENTINHVFDDKFNKFLKKLGYLLTKYYIEEKELQIIGDSNILYCDLIQNNSENESELLFSSTEETAEFIPINNKPTSLFYDKENNIIYKISSGIKEYFSHYNGCAKEFYWNYKDDFIWNIDNEILDELNDNHTLSFYRSTNYLTTNADE